MDFYFYLKTDYQTESKCFNTDSPMEKIQGCFQGFSETK